MSYPILAFNESAGHANDCTTTTGWTQEIGPSLPAPTISCEYGDYIKLGGTPAGPGDESCYWEVNVTPDIDAELYKYYVLRWKTTVATTGLGARVEIRYAAGVPINEWILGETVPQFSDPANTFEVTVGTLSDVTGKDIDCVRFYADDYPNAVAAGGTFVWFDLLLLTESPFTFPKCDVDLFLPAPRIPVLEPPGRNGDILQNLGSKMARVHIQAEMTHESTSVWGTPKGQRFLQACHEQSDTLFHWLNLQSHGVKFKVCIDQEPLIRYANGRLTLDLWLKEYKLAPMSAIESYAERFGI